MIAISAEPATNIVSLYDDVLINTTNFGLATWTTKRANLQYLMTGGLPAVEPALSQYGFLSNNQSGVTLSGAFSGTFPLASATNTAQGSLSSNLFTHALSIRRNSWLARPPISFSLYQDSYVGSEILNQASNLCARGFTRAGQCMLALDANFFGATRDGSGNLQPGAGTGITNMSAFVSQLHALGVWVSVYVYPHDYTGDTTETQAPIDSAHLEQDAQTIAQWGVDAVKCDHVGNFDLSQEDFLRQWHERFAQALDRAAALSGRSHPVLLDVGLVPATQTPTVWVPNVANAFRVGTDPQFAASPTLYQHTNGWYVWMTAHLKYDYLVGPGCYPEWEGANSSSNPIWTWMTTNDVRAICGIGAMMSAMLNCATYPSAIPDVDLGLVWTNRDFWHVDQDFNSKGYPVLTNGNTETWVKPPGPGSREWAVALWNKDTNVQNTVSCDLTNLPGILTNLVFARDVFTHAGLFFTNSISATVNTNGLNLYVVEAAKGPSCTITNGTNTTSPILTFENGRLVSYMVPALPITNAIQTNLVAWFNASTQTFASGTVTNWPDITTNHFDATNTAGTQPIFLANQIDGLPAYCFTNNGFLVTPYASNDTSFTIFAVWKSFPGGNNPGIVTRSGNGYTGGPFLAAVSGAAGQAEAYWSAYGAASITNPPANTWGISCLRWTNNGTVQVLGFNNLSNGVPTSATSVGTGQLSLAVQGYPNTSGNIQGEIAEVLYYNIYLSDAAVATVRTNYLQLKYPDAQ